MTAEIQTSTEPMVSVVMIAYNKEKYIDEAIRGVVKQRVDWPIELIVMDDYSTDATSEKALEWCRKYPHIVRYVRNPENLGLQRNYMAGFALCRGRYMAICDADDYWFYRGKLAKMVSYMEQNQGCAVSFHRMVNYYEGSGEKSLSNGGTPRDTTIADLSRSNYITNSAVMYRRGLVDLLSLPEWIAEDRSPDYAMHMLYAAHGSIHFFSRPMGVYRKAGGSAWSMIGRRRRLEMSLTVRERLLETLGHIPGVREGLEISIKNIYGAMESMDDGVDKPQERLLTRIRRLVSRLVSLPK